MNKITSMLTAAFFMGTVVFLASCSKDDPAKPAPTITTESSSLTVIADTTKTVTVNISAAAGIKDITATIDKATLGTVDITNKADLTGKLVADATLSFTSTFALGSGTITIVVTDNSDQTAQAQIAVTVTDHPAIEIAGAIGDTGKKETHITKATTWGPHLTYHVTSNVFVEPAGSLTLLEGTTVIVDGKFSFTVRGNFYSLGTATDSVKFTVPPTQRTKANIFAGLWGGVLSSNTDGKTNFAANEMVVTYTRMEYAGMLVEPWQDIYKLGEVADNAPEYALFFNNLNGKFVLQNSTIAYTADVAVQVDQGTVLINNNAFLLNGKAGGEAIDTKIGTNGDIAFNLFYKVATNGVKYNAKGGTSDLRIYNNTAVECGWRQTSHSDHGGSFNAEQGAKGVVYNNLIVNSTRGVRFSNGKIPDVAHLSNGYNFHYFGVTTEVGSDKYTPTYYPADGFIMLGNGKTTPNNVDSTYEAKHDMPAPVFTANKYDVAATVAGQKDPMFAGYNTTAFNAAAAVTSEEPANEGFVPASLNFHLKAGSPALTGAKTGFATFTSGSLSAGGKTYAVPAPAAYFGAYGSN